ncbi:MAG TPA: 30S ribosome-binding factor RbfA, partial [Gammaproteobacteria bacterium]|nr:30S ribosome-binding factor RbfA [Gammaproteobacteria bacterium]
MSEEFSRTRRVGEQIQRELAELLQREVKDPRVAGVTVTAVEVSRDLAHAKVYVSRMTGETDWQETLAGLGRAAGFLRRELGRRLTMRSVPELRFLRDRSIEGGARLSELI